MFKNKVSQEIFEILKRALTAGDSLSLRNIGGELDLAPNTILYHFKKLEEKGLIVRNSAGKVIRVNSPEDGLALAYLPLLARAPCGPPLEEIVDEATVRMIPVPLNLLGRNQKRNLFLIEAVGDSMSDKIESGDFVVFESKPSPLPGQIVIARTKDGFTIKVFRENRTQIILEPLNKKYLPLVFDKNALDNNLNIDGVSIGVFKPQENLGGDD